MEQMPITDTDVLLTSAYKQLRPIERLFVDAYLADLENDATAAGRRVVDYLHMTGKNPRLAGYYADKLMKQPLVRAAISERIEDMTRAMELSAYKVLREVSHVAMSTMANYFTFDGYGDPVLQLHNCTPEQLAAIGSIEIEENTLTGKKKVKFKLHDKMKGLDMLMRHMGLYADDNAQLRPVVPPGQMPAAITQASSTAQAADLYARTLRRAS